jgi:hypothetical protein
MRPPRPSNEQERLRALRELDILDTGPEPDLDDIVELAATICGTPTSQVSLVDGDRVCAKASVNAVDPDAPRDDSFCAHAILGKGCSSSTTPVRTCVSATIRTSWSIPVCASTPGRR